MLNFVNNKPHRFCFSRIELDYDFAYEFGYVFYVLLVFTRQVDDITSRAKFVRKLAWSNPTSLKFFIAGTLIYSKHRR